MEPPKHPMDSASTGQQARMYHDLEDYVQHMNAAYSKFRVLLHEKARQEAAFTEMHNYTYILNSKIKELNMQLQKVKKERDFYKEDAHRLRNTYFKASPKSRSKALPILVKEDLQLTTIEEEKTQVETDNESLPSYVEESDSEPVVYKSPDRENRLS